MRLGSDHARVLIRYRTGLARASYGIRPSSSRQGAGATVDQAGAEKTSVKPVFPPISKEFPCLKQ
jgi:hypothetical protein